MRLAGPHADPHRHAVRVCSAAMSREASTFPLAGLAAAITGRSAPAGGIYSRYSANALARASAAQLIELMCVAWAVTTQRAAMT